MTQSIGATQQLKELTEFRSAASVVGQQYKELLATTSPVARAVRAGQESREQHEHIRKMLEPLADIRKRFMVEEGIRRQMHEAALGATAIRDQFREAISGLSGIGSVAKIWAQQMEDARAQTRSAYEGITLGSAIKKQLKDFEHINKQWRVAPELLGVVGSLKELQNQFGKVALPTIDWGSAAALAKLLGEQGLQEQLAHLGIEPDGSLREPKEAPEKGLLSRKQSDAVALVGLLLAIIGIWMALQMFYYQENAGAAQQAKNDEHASKQMRQLESLGRLVEKALEHSAIAQEERFVVRDRPATVRSKPEHGAAIEGKLMPNEVVRAIDKEGKWVEVEYYHWLREEYRTGWLLKKYMERVPANYAKAAPDPKP
ncbi:SH3 domain-containing protein [Hydrogenophaga sp. ZJX-1]|uniref:SH3 domain-containing protein n=1 Tax=Hydrogenophaga sp. ZJX-1 TaxID=3404778 RepID=UPI003B28473E